jgi:large repetitive protein
VVTDDRGATDSRDHDAEAKAPPPPPENKAPHAEFEVHCSDMTCTFQDRSTDDDGTIQSHSWTFGDGTSSTETNPTHTYSIPDKYKVTLVVTDDRGATDSRDHDAEAKAPPPANTSTQITSDGPDPSEPGQQITVSFTVTAGSGTADGPVTISDANGGGCSGDAPSGNCSYTPNGTGSRTITATYAGNAGFQRSSDTEQHTVNQPPPPNEAPTAAFNPPSCTVGVACQFNDASRDDGTVVAWEWDFGENGAKSTLQNPEYTYTSSGAHTVKLRVTDNAGQQSAETQHTVDVAEAPTAPNSAPVAQIGSITCTGTHCEYSDNSTDPDGAATIARYAWLFGDGESSDAQNPTHDYANPGDYTVTLTVTDDHNATDQTARGLAVQAPPSNIRSAGTLIAKGPSS